MQIPVFIMLMSLSTVAMAWGETGHRVTGAIADEHLPPSTRARVQALLGAEDLARVATWADDMRSSPAAYWQEQAGPLHYVTVPADMTYKEIGAPPEGDAYVALTTFAATLRNPETSLEQQQLALKFSIHLIGDLHQPLHVGNGEDQGGNQVQVTWFGESSNLHRVWDSAMINSKNLSYSELAHWLLAEMTPTQQQNWREPDPLVWIAESAALRPGVYPQAERLSWNYRYEHFPTVERRLAQAGIRIAAWLEWVYSEPVK